MLDAPLSFQQEYLWYQQQLEPHSVIFNETNLFRVRGALDVALFQRALNALVERHFSLRATFHLEGETPVQRVLPPAPADLPVYDFASPASARDFAARQGLRPFDLERGPLARYSLLRLAPDDFYFCLEAHHIIYDGWSRQIILADLYAFYDAYLRGQAPTLPDLPLSMPEFVRWQRSWLQGDTRQSLSDFWGKQLAGELPVFELPYDLPHPTRASAAGVRLEFTLTASLTSRLKDLARRNQVSPYAIYTTAYFLLLQRYCGVEDLIIGSIFANRAYRSLGDKLDSLVGMFVNTMPVRVTLDGPLTISETIQRVATSLTNTIAHQSYPFGQLVADLQPERVQGRNPFFQAVINYLKFPALTARGELLDICFENAPDLVTPNELSLEIAEQDNQLHGFLRYRTGLFSPELIARMLLHYQNILTGLLLDGTQPVSSIEMLTADERRLLTAAGTPLQPPHPAACLHHPLPLHAQSTPGAPAVICRDVTLRYADLEQRSNQLARFLQDSGVEHETLVGLYLPRSADLIVAQLAALKAGGAYLPLDIFYPAERIRFMLADARPRLTLTTRSLAAQLPPEVDVILLDEIWPQVALMDASAPPCPSGPDSLAYVMYTSGSTGQPKGVMTEHRGAVSFIQQMIAAQGLTSSERVIQFTSFSFDASVRDTLGVLAFGGALVLMDDEQMRDPSSILAALREHHITCILSIVPTLLRELLQQAESEQSSAPSLRLVMPSGEALEYADARKLWLRWGESIRLVNQYGPTETTMIASTCTIDPLEARQDGLAPIGRAISGRYILLLDPHLQPVPPGAVGEIYIGGPGLARGYLNQPELTAARFIPDPFRPGGRLYRSGDLARLRPDGLLVFAGRGDQQVKFRGYRVELMEIEAVLRQHPAVQEAAVLLWDKTRLAAYVVSQEPQADFHSFLSARLPFYMIPASFTVLDALPRTPNGKLDRLRLPAPQQNGAERTPPRDETETRLAAIWADVLLIDPPGVRENFFALGGHSLMAVRLLARIHQQFGKRLPLSVIFEGGTIEGMALRLKDESPALFPASHPPSLASDEPVWFAPTTVQEAQWFLQQFSPESAAYNNPCLLGLDGELSLSALEQALNLIVERHALLRTVFPFENERIWQKILPFTPLRLPFQDLSAVPETLDAQLSDLTSQPFDLIRDLPFRACLFRLDAHKHILCIVFHHIAFDAWSYPVFKNELQAAYTAFNAGQPPSLPDLPIQYADYARDQRTWMATPQYTDMLAYWTARMGKQPPVFELPADFPRPALQSFRASHAALSLGAAFSARLAHFCSQQRITQYQLVLAALNALFYRQTGQKSIILGAPFANRTSLDVEDLIGMFINTLPLRVDMTGGMTFAQLFNQVKSEMAAAIEHASVPFDRIVADLQLPRDLSRTPLYQVFVNMRNVPNPKLAGGLLFFDLPVDRQSRYPLTRFDLEINLNLENNLLTVVCVYCADLYRPETIDRLLQNLKLLLELAVQNPELALDALPLTGIPTPREVIFEQNQTATALPYPGLLEAFEKNVRQVPEKTAATFAGQSLTYAELNRRANRLAHYLRARGLQPDAVVGIYLDRSLEMLIAQLAVLKAGAAYLSLDPNYPDGRLAWMLEDSGAALLLSDARLGASLPAGDIPQVTLESIPAGDYSSENPVPAAAPHHLMYLLYTSGSTGQPKGVQVTMGGAANVLGWVRDVLGFSAQDSILGLTSFSFDISVVEMLLPLYCGGTVHILPSECVHDARLLSKAFADLRPTMMQATPATWRMLVDVGWQGHPGLQIITGGEALSPELAGALLKRCARLWNLYGPTEGSIYNIGGQVLDAVPPISIGKPIANNRVYILDEDRNPLPFGASGEMYQAGAGVARGYHQRPDLTAERFLPDPFFPGQSMYRSGDLARYLPDGRIQFLGRADFQMKVRGFRVEPEEIEFALKQHTAIHDAVVVAAHGADAGILLTAYYVPLQSPTSSADLRAFLQPKLPAYLVPSVFIALENFPLTLNKKVDRRALAARPLELSAGAASQTLLKPPATPTEQKMLEIWQAVLQVAPIGVDQEFIDLGGDSITSIRLFFQIEAVFNLFLSLNVIFQYGTVESLSAYLDAILAGGKKDLGQYDSWDLTFSESPDS